MIKQTTIKQATRLKTSKKVLSFMLTAVIGLIVTTSTVEAGGDKPMPDAPKIGQPAPGFTAINSNGDTVSLADYKGKTVILEWTNHDCPFVEKHYNSGNMQTLQNQARSQGFVWLSIISSAKGKQGQVDGTKANDIARQKNAMPTAILLDIEGKVGRAYDAKTTPHMFIIDPEGILRYQGAIDSISSASMDDIKTATNYVQQAMNEMIAGKPVSTSDTTPYGCSVKY